MLNCSFKDFLSQPSYYSLTVHFFCRRGSNLSLLLDVSTLGVEPVCSVSTPKEVWLQLLHTSSRPLTHAMLQQAAIDTNTLNVEYQVTHTHRLRCRCVVCLYLCVLRCVCCVSSTEDSSELCERRRARCSRSHDQRPIQNHPAQSVSAVLPVPLQTPSTLSPSCLALSLLFTV